MMNTNNPDTEIDPAILREWALAREAWLSARAEGDPTAEAAAWERYAALYLADLMMTDR